MVALAASTKIVRCRAPSASSAEPVPTGTCSALSALFADRIDQLGLPQLAASATVQVAFNVAEFAHRACLQHGIRVVGALGAVLRDLSFLPAVPVYRTAGDLAGTPLGHAPLLFITRVDALAKSISSSLTIGAGGPQHRNDARGHPNTQVPTVAPSQSCGRQPDPSDHNGALHNVAAARQSVPQGPRLGNCASLL